VYIGDPNPPASTSYLDQNSLPNRAYFYAVKAHNAFGDSGFSGPDIATTVIYTDPDLTASMVIRAVHLTELRTAADELRGLAGGVAFTYTDPTIVAGSTIVRAAHFQEVEAVLREARNTLGMSVPAPLGIVVGTVVPVAQIIALRTYAQ
jgi:hypothetical protein